MKVLLLKNVNGLGNAGEVKSVKDGFAKNFLFPQKKAVLAKSDVLEEYKREQEKKEMELELLRKGSSLLKVDIEKNVFDIEFPIGPNGKLIGSVTSNDISKVLKTKNIVLEKKKIKLFNKINKTGVFDVECKLDNGITATIKINVTGFVSIQNKKK
jgi:large subunit ribosomal protein L9